MRDQVQDEQWIRAQTGERSSEGVYVTANHYDGGYEVRVGTVDFFVDYESIDADDDAVIRKYLSKL